MKEYPNVFVFDHPLIKHKISILRDKNTGMKEFRELVEEITQIMTYVSMEDVALVPVEVETPLEKTVQYRIPEESVAIVPILRAGAGHGERRAQGVPHGARRAYRHVPR